MKGSLAIFSQLFESMPVGVVVLDHAGRVVVYNAAEEKLAGRQKDRVMGRSFFTEVAPCMNVRDLGQHFAENIGRAAISRELDFSFPFPHVDRPRDVRVRLQSFDVEASPYALLLVEDTSAERAIARMKETLQNLLVHDLKNPLASVLANFGFALEHPSVRDNVDIVEAMQDGIMSSQRLQTMILNLLDIGRLETSSMPVNRAATPIRTMLGEIVAGARAVAALRRATVSMDPATVDATVSIDAALVRRCVENLVDNALRFSTAVEVGARSTPAGLEVCVADNGPGIPPAVRDHIFDKYVQVSGPKGNTDQNRGLGLTFVRLAARAHGGDATCECPARGGTVFTLALPTS